MRLSKSLFKTLKETPSEATISSHILLIRAGMIRKLASGVYGYMQLGLRSIKKIEAIVREEMDKSGGQEIIMSAIQPAELWEETKRWYDYGPELWRLKDRHDRSFCLGPTHEEIFTDIVRNEINSYRQLPINLYQIQTKYRDEARPRFGLMRSREFIMKDSYSFDLNRDGLDESYKLMYETYDRIFRRCGLKFMPVEADNGAIGGSQSHEFIAISEAGESEIAYCEHCKMAATLEKAEVLDSNSDEEMLSVEEVHTPNIKTIDELSNFLKIKKEDTIKAVMFKSYDEHGKFKEYVIAFLRGDRELNITKLVNGLGVQEYQIELAEDNDIEIKTGCVLGFTGPVGLKNCKLVIDSEIPSMRNLCGGACKKDYHVKNLNYGRDFDSEYVFDIKTLKEGDICPSCKESDVKVDRGIEVGQVFKLGTKYSESMGAYYMDENMKEQLIQMGCYGIGVSRTLAAIVEQHHDDDGIIWPMAVAPYHVYITVIKVKDDEQMNLANSLYEDFSAKGVEVILDDRDERAGVKFKDRDLLGIPIGITVGRDASDNKVEFKLRNSSEKEVLSVDEVKSKVFDLVAEYCK